MVKNIIATTTINPPTKALIKYSQLSEWHVIVAGDLKTPHDLFSSLDNVTYLSPDDQVKRSKRLSDLIGWKCIQRRNFAVLEAFLQGADNIAVIDDDNVPFDDWGKDLLLGKKSEVNFYETNQPVFDPIGATNYTKLWHRGFPLQLVPDRDYSKISKRTVTPSIQANFWNGEPDVDAVCRMIYRPNCTFEDRFFPISSNAMTPVNSQNTVISRSVINDYFLFPGIGRMDDIWASYYAQAKGHKVVFTKPSVLSDRSLGTDGRYPCEEDMRREYIGYEYSLALIRDLQKDPESIVKYLPVKSWEAYQEFKALTKE